MTPGTDAVAVLGLGLCTPLGLTAPTTLVEMAAGTVRFFLTGVLDSTGEPVRASMLSLLETRCSRTDRIVALAATALQECLDAVPLDKRETLPLFMALSGSVGGVDVERTRLLEALAQVASPYRLHLEADGLCHEGRAGFFAALSRAMAALHAGRARQVLVGAADSFCDPGSLKQLLGGRRLRCSTVRDGIIPGEGAGFVLLTRASTARHRGLRPQGLVLAATVAKEPRPMTCGKPSLAEGLTTAFHYLRTHPATERKRVAQVLSCQTGETFWGHEFNRAYLRNASLMPEPLRVMLLAETQGDVGAGAGVVQFGLALQLLGEQVSSPASEARMLVYGCSDEGQVGACIIGREI
ncbi:MULTISPECIES: beta-ketoacyl synthase N-terminal-like domain-containing protein [Myxococcus]|uniref:beta-ketoacyl synthase N-terminal-like domain-containing protein n=1 Tax=Myxococcus TaxID=32 RepID=UPI0013D753BF|nr:MULTISPECIES: beta-ketoacyl synthase N-terminal-like domain-containing protein [Myxococcus]NVJ24469.1 3-oxoacyl-ACP synthase [Myxococcus sp. AM011]